MNTWVIVGLIVIAVGSFLGGILVYYGQTLDSNKGLEGIKGNQSDAKDAIIKTVESGNNKMSKYIDQEVFFREGDFSILKKFFPKGFLIIRQNYDGEIFKKSTFEESELHEISDIEITFQNDTPYISHSGNVADLNGNIIEGFKMIGVPVSLDSKHKLIVQSIGSIKHDDACQGIVVLNKDKTGFTYGLGYYPCP